MLLVRNSRKISGGEQLLNLNEEINFFWRKPGLLGSIGSLKKLIILSLKKNYSKKIVIFGALLTKTIVRDFIFLLFLKIIGKKVIIHSRSTKNIYLGKFLPKNKFVVQNYFDSLLTGLRNFSERNVQLSNEKSNIKIKNYDFFFYFGRISKEKGIEKSLKFCEKLNLKLKVFGPIENNSYFKSLTKYKSFSYMGVVPKNKISIVMTELSSLNGCALLYSDYEGYSNFLTECIRFEIPFFASPDAGRDIYLYSNLSKIMKKKLQIKSRGFKDIWAIF